MKKSELLPTLALLLSASGHTECRPVGGINHMKQISHDVRNANPKPVKERKRKSKNKTTNVDTHATPPAQPTAK
jgi:hypothetical protein